MAALEAAVTGTRLQGFVSGGTVQPDQRTQDEAAAAAAPGRAITGLIPLSDLLSEGSDPAVHTPTAFCSAGAPAAAVVNSEDIELGDGMDEDEDDAEEPTGDVQLQQKAVPVRPSACIHLLIHI